MPREQYIIPQSYLIFRTPGVVPTVPDPPTLRKYHNDFLDTDLEIGCWAKNIPDRKVFFRSESGIIEYDDDSGDLEGSLGNPDTDGEVLSSTAAGVRSWMKLVKAFQSINFANPLTIDCTTYKDWICASITGATAINITNASDGDSGVIECIMDSTGGYAITFGANMTKRIGTFDNTANKDNVIYWRKAGANIIYKIEVIA